MADDQWADVSTLSDVEGEAAMPVQGPPAAPRRSPSTIPFTDSRDKLLLREEAQWRFKAQLLGAVCRRR